MMQDRAVPLQCAVIVSKKDDRDERDWRTGVEYIIGETSWLNALEAAEMCGWLKCQLLALSHLSLRTRQTHPEPNHIQTRSHIHLQQSHSIPHWATSKSIPTSRRPHHVSSALPGHIDTKGFVLYHHGHFSAVSQRDWHSVDPTLLESDGEIRMGLRLLAG